MNENNMKIEYLFFLENTNTRQSFIDTNSENLKNNFIDILTYVPSKRTKIIDTYELTIYSDNSYLLIKMPTEIKDKYGRNIPVICILSLKDFKEINKINDEIWNNQIEFIKDKLINFSKKIGYLISQEFIDKNFVKLNEAMTPLLIKRGIKKKVAITIAIIIAGLLGLIILKKLVD